MNTIETDEPQAIPQRYAITDAAIASMRETFMPLKIIGVNDADGYKKVHEARMVVKNHRVSVEKVRKELKADALEYGRKVDAEAKRITALLEPIESHLSDQEEAIDAEKERIKNAERLRIEAEAKAKADAEAARIKAEHDAEVERMRIEREKLEADRAALEAEREKENARIKAEQDKIDAEKKRLADIEAARQREIENERIRTEAAEKARIETEQRIEREAAIAKAKEQADAEAAKAKAEAEEAERLRVESLRPDRVKLLCVAENVGKITVPAVGDNAVVYAYAITTVLQQTVERIHSIVNEMS